MKFVPFFKLLYVGRGQVHQVTSYFKIFPKLTSLLKFLFHNCVAKRGWAPQRKSNTHLIMASKSYILLVGFIILRHTYTFVDILNWSYVRMQQNNKLVLPTKSMCTISGIVYFAKFGGFVQYMYLATIH